MTDTRDLTLTFELHHPPQKVWRALTDPDLLAQWLMKTDLAPDVGHRFVFRREPMEHWDGIVNCAVLKVDEPHSISYTWRALGVDTVVTWTLEETDYGTLLTLQQTGFDADNRQAYGGARGGWNYMAGELLPELLAELQ